MSKEVKCPKCGTRNLIPLVQITEDRWMLCKRCRCRVFKMIIRNPTFEKFKKYETNKKNKTQRKKVKPEDFLI